MAAELSAPPVLSTPAEHILEEDPTSNSALSEAERPHRTDDELFEVYEIERTAKAICDRGWRRVALQFPDAMLPDSPWVVGALSKELKRLGPAEQAHSAEERVPEAEETEVNKAQDTKEQPTQQQQETRLYVLADTSYSACCVDEIAAEHIHADAVVHYGRACLSPTARLPVFYVFTRQRLDYDAVVDAFEKEFSDQQDKVVIMADVMFQEHVMAVCEKLRERGWLGVRGTEIVRDPGAIIPNRKVIDTETDTKVSETESSEMDVSNNTQADLTDHHLFHIAAPPTALLLTLSSRMASLHIFPTPDSPYTTSTSSIDPVATPRLLNRRYALVLRLATASIIGILVNTLSVKNYLSTVTTLKEEIAAAGKKSYTIVVGKLNAAKLANFAEIDGWVVVGCWESGLVEQEGMWRPVVTPFELGLALQGDETRVWNGSWWGGIEGVKTAESKQMEPSRTEAADAAEEVEGGVDDEESEAPEFDLRTGKLVNHSRPMRFAIRSAASKDTQGSSSEAQTAHGGASSSALVQRKTGEVAMINGVVSPGAEFLRSQRTWQGLGSTQHDNEEDEYEESTVVEEGRSGIARGYTVGEGARR